jgi:predicted metal-dependent phosphotriesterase family hydrolase
MTTHSDARAIAPTGTIDVLTERNPFGNLFNVRNTIPCLRQMGVTDEQIRTITVMNPKAFFARS